MTRLSDNAIITIRKLHADGIKQVALASQFQVTQTYISKLVRGEKRPVLLGRPIHERRCIDCNTPITRGKRCATCTEKRHHCRDCGKALQRPRQQRCNRCRKAYIRNYNREWRRAQRSLTPKESEITV